MLGALLLLALNSPWSISLSIASSKEATLWAPTTAPDMSDATGAVPSLMQGTGRAAGEQRRALALPVPSYFSQALAYAGEARQHHLTYLLSLFHQVGAAGWWDGWPCAVHGPWGAHTHRMDWVLHTPRALTGRPARYSTIAFLTPCCSFSAH